MTDLATDLMPAAHLTLVSIIVINHNYAAYLPKAIESALAQTWPHCEVVVVDDGSTDSSRDIIASYGPRIRPVLKPAGGHVSAANAGFAAATGSILIFLDADDLLYADCVAALLEAWNEADIKIQFRLDTIDQNGLDQEMPFPYFAPDLTPDAVRAQAFEFGSYPWTVSSGNAYAKTFLAQLMPIDAEEIYRSPDGYFNKMAPLFGDVHSLPEVLGAYRVHGANAWAQDSGGVRLGPVIRWLNFDLVLQSKFERTAVERGITVRSGGNSRTVQHVEYRLLARRLAQEETPYAADTGTSVLKLGVQAAFAAPNMSWKGRIIWCLWFAMLCFAPKPTVRWAFGMARTQRGRAQFIRLIVASARGSAKKAQAKSLS